MAQQINNMDVDPRELARSRDMWHSFTVLVKRSVIAIAVAVAVLGLLTL